MSRTLWVLISGIALTATAFAAPAEDLETTKKAIQEAWARHKSMSATVRTEFSREGEDAVGQGRGEGRVQVLHKGELYLERSELHTEIKRTSPDPQECAFMASDVKILLDGVHEYVVRESNGQKTCVKQAINPGISVVPQTVLEFQSQSAELKALPEESIDDQKVWVIEAVRTTPKRRADSVRTVLYFLQDSGALRRKESYDAAGAKVETTDYGDFQFDVDLDPQSFVFEAPPGVTVIDRTKPRDSAAASQRSPIVGVLPAPSSRPTDSAPAKPDESPRP